MKQRTLQQCRALRSVLFILLLGVVGVTKGYAYDFSAVCSTGQTLYYNIIDGENHYVELTSPRYYNGWIGYTKPIGNIVLPSNVQYDGESYSVTRIGDYAFFQCDELTGELVIPNSVTEVGYMAFYCCSGLTGELVFPNSMTTIGNRAFDSCIGLTGLSIPNSVTIIGDQAFYGCYGLLGNLVIPNSVITIGGYAFNYCYSLTGLVISNSVTTIGIGAFNNCIGIVSVMCLAETPPMLGNWAFSSVDKGVVVKVPCGCVESYASISWGGFWNFSEMCGNTVSVVANPENGGMVSGGGTFELGQICTITAIANEDYFFAKWTLNGVNISNSAEYTFPMEGDMEFVAHFVPDSNIVFADANVKAICISHWDTNSDGELSYMEAASVTDLSNYFSNNTVITSFEELQYFIGLTSIGDCTFSNCRNLVNLVIPNSVVSIGYRAFLYCSSLTGNLVIPDSVTSIGVEAFLYCTGFTGNLVIPSSVTSIGQYAFAECTGFTGSLIIPGSVDTIGYSAFMDCRGFTGELVIPSSVTTIGNFCFGNCSGFTSLIVPNTVTSIGNCAFSFCTGLTSLIIPSSITSIGQQAFMGCDHIASITSFAETPPAVGNQAFYLVNSSTIVNVPCGSGEEYASVSWGGFSNFHEMCVVSIVVSASPEEGGCVVGGGTFEAGQTCNVTAIANTGYTFESWNKNGQVVSTNSTYSFVVIENTILEAVFTLNSYEIASTANPANGGTITGSGTYNHGQTCTLTATANQGYTFVNWTENGTVVSTNANYTFTVNANRNLVANFSANTYTIGVSTNPANGGTVTGNGSYTYGQGCTLTATAATGYTFASWNENCQALSTNSIYSFVVTGNRTLEAVFTLNSYEITATANPANGGTVTGTGTYSHGQTCTLTATANENYTFTNWMENGETVSTDSIYSFEVTASRTLVANFMGQSPITNPWTPVAPGLYSNSTTIHGVILIDGVEQYTDQLELGVFCGDECRGTCRPEEFFITHRYLASVNVFGENGNELTFKLFDHNLGEELDLTPPASVVFTDDGLGSPVEPYELNFVSTFMVSALVYPEEAGTVEGTGEYGSEETCTLVATANPGFQFRNWTLDGNVVSTDPIFVFTVMGAVSYVAHFNTVQTDNLVLGWNWWSTYIEQEGINGLEMLENSLDGSGIRIQGKLASTDYFVYQGTGYWYGFLNALQNDQMYKVRTSEACNAVIIGDEALPVNHPITIGEGWNWVGFPSGQPLSVDEAMSGFEPEGNDIIKGRNSSTTYISYGNYNMWYGQLNTLEPGQGYMYKSNSSETKTLVYQTGRGTEELKPNITPEVNVFVPAVENYADNMLITAVIELDGEELRSEDYELAAFVGDECRGSVKLMYVEPFDIYVAFLLAFGEASEEMYFVLTDGNDVSLSDDLVRYETDGTVGTLTEPVTLHFGTLGVEDGKLLPVHIYPNPSKDIFNVEGVGIKKVEVVDTYGQVIFSTEVENDNLQINLSDKAAGAYLFRVVTDKGVATKKLVLMR